MKRRKGGDEKQEAKHATTASAELPGVSALLHAAGVEEPDGPIDAQQRQQDVGVANTSNAHPQGKANSEQNTLSLKQHQPSPSSYKTRHVTYPRPKNFAERLMSALQVGIGSDSVWWVSDGAAVALHRKNLMRGTVMEEHFRAKNYGVFLRNFNRWGFHRVTNISVPEGVVTYQNSLFRKDRPHLVKHMRMDSDVQDVFERHQSEPEHSDSGAVSNTNNNVASIPRDPGTLEERQAQQFASLPARLQERLLGVTNANFVDQPQSQQNSHVFNQNENVVPQMLGSSFHNNVAPVSRDSLLQQISELSRRYLIQPYRQDDVLESAVRPALRFLRMQIQDHFRQQGMAQQPQPPQQQLQNEALNANVVQAFQNSTQAQYPAFASASAANPLNSAPNNILGAINQLHHQQQQRSSQQSAAANTDDGSMLVSQLQQLLQQAASNPNQGGQPQTSHHHQQQVQQPLPMEPPHQPFQQQQQQPTQNNSNNNESQTQPVQQLLLALLQQWQQQHQMGHPES